MMMNDWKLLTISEQAQYIDRAKYLIERGYALGDIFEVAAAIYTREAKPKMKIKSIKKIGIRPLYDISVADAHHYILDNGAVTHNTGIYYSANQIFIIGRQQNKDGDELVGYNFIINIEKSRYVREKTKVPLTVSFEGGISRWSGLIDIALESGHVIKPKAGWYQKVDGETGAVLEKNYRLKDTDSAEFWNPILRSKSFNDYIEKTYRVAFGPMTAAAAIADDQQEGSDND